uniref:protein-ribulosamine 3-kinase n=1 Tax=Serinus canaria TaxID=9135 RepID=A0A8C9NL86_SERCA
MLRLLCFLPCFLLSLLLLLRFCFACSCFFPPFSLVTLAKQSKFLSGLFSPPPPLDLLTAPDWDSEHREREVTPCGCSSCLNTGGTDNSKPPGETFLNLSSFSEQWKSGVIRHSALLGTQLADLHLHNQRFGERVKKEGNIVGKGEGQSEFQFVDQFGFHTVTCCGYLPQVNDWQSDWVTFFARQRIQPQMDMIEKKSGDKEARELWAQLQLKIPSFFSDIEIIPALLHGDLWGGNISENESGPVIFDPACFYGHSEYDLAIAGMFGGFSNSFYSAYHSKIPRAAGFEKRLKLYQLFHYLNHWNHFGSGYRGSSLNIMRNLVN